VADAAVTAPASLAAWLAAAPAALVERPALGDPLAAYRHLPARLRSVRDHLLAPPGADDAGAAGSMLSAGRQGEAAFAHWAAARFESECLGRRIAQMTTLAGWGGNTAARAAAAALATALAAAGAGGVELMLAKVPERDALAGGVLREAGFAAIARKLTYYYMPGYSSEVAPIRARHAVRTYRPDDLDALVALGRRFQHSQYRRLPGVTGAAVDGLYERWIERACAGEFADTVLVAEAAGRPVAFSSFKGRADTLAVTGLRVLGQGLGAVEPRASGALVALILTMRDLVDRGAYDAAEFDFYEENVAVRRALERLGFRPVGSAAVMFLELQQSG
jgi:RimJ/RimL family protein N-acetyltransferase